MHGGKATRDNATKSGCPHLAILNQYENVEAIDVHPTVCDFCDYPGPYLWICLHRDCLAVSCGGSVNNHTIRHFQRQREHCLILSITTLSLYCFLCEREVILDAYDPPIPRMLQTSSTTRTTDTDSEDEITESLDDIKPKGLTGLQNMGNTCYMNSALQSLSNCPQLTNFFLDCDAFVKPDKKPGLARSYMLLIREIWHKKRPSYVVPSAIASGIRAVFPVFRGCVQQDAQEFLRYFMDQLHEELKEPVVEFDSSPLSSEEFDSVLGHSSMLVSEESSQSDCDYETCESDEPNDKNSSSGDLTDRSEQSQKSNTAISRSDFSQNEQKSISRQDSASSLHSEQHLSLNACSLHADNLKRDSGTSEHSYSSSSAIDTRLLHCKGNFSSPEERKSSLDVNPEAMDEISYASKHDSGISTSLCSSHAVSEKEKSVQLSQLSRAASFLIRNSAISQKKKPVQYRSIISDIFDGKILSSVQCLTCDTVSSTKETFQDLSLPIPTRDHLNMIHASQSSSQQKSGAACTDVYSQRGWLSSFVSWMFSWFIGPSISLQDCLAAFFSADELKGDNMYSCEKCRKLRNGIKYSKVIELPEVLCIHLKRFRHEVMYSSKINSYVSFPLEGLDMSLFLHKSFPQSLPTYDLVSVICHHGTAGSGHYTAYALNYFNDQWYEYDDQYITAVDAETVRNCEAYVLFYRKNGEEMIRKRQNAVELLKRSKIENGLLKFFISKQWLNKFNTFAEPGPITNTDFLCVHGGVHPSKNNIANELCTSLPQAVWEYLHDTFGGGPPCTHLYICPVCQAEVVSLNHKRKSELEEFLAMNAEFRRLENPTNVFALSMAWFKVWENFVCRDGDVPGPIDNSPICFVKNNSTVLRSNSDYCSVSLEMFEFLHSIYGGGPAVALRPSHLSLSSSDSSVVSFSKSPVQLPCASVQNVQVHNSLGSANLNVSSHSKPSGSASPENDAALSDNESTEYVDTTLVNESLLDVKTQ